MNTNEATYSSMSIDDLHKELAKPNLLAEDRTLLLHTIAKKRADNVTSQPVTKPTNDKIR